MGLSSLKVSISAFIGVIWIGVGWGVYEIMRGPLPIWQTIIAEGGLGIIFTIILYLINKERK